MRNLTEAFEALEFHPWHGKNFAKLSMVNRESCCVWLKARENDSRDKVEMSIHRLWLDMEKPKNYTLMMELMVCANSMAREQK